MHVKKLSECMWKKLLEGWLAHAKIKAFERAGGDAFQLQLVRM
jgi:hypothetical protein